MNTKKQKTEFDKVEVNNKALMNYRDFVDETFSKLDFLIEAVSISDEPNSWGLNIASDLISDAQKKINDLGTKIYNV